MNRVVIIAVALIVILLAIGGFLFLGSRGTKNQTAQKVPNGQSTQAPVQNVNNQAPVQNVMPQVVKALQGSGSVKCTYLINAVTATSYIKNGKVRYELGISGKQSNTIIKDKIVYSWLEGSNTGTMMDTTNLSVSKTPGNTGTSEVKDLDSYKTSLENYHPDCSTQAVDDSIFEKPAGVTFTDLTKMMENMKSQIPANVTVPAGYKIPGQ